MTLDYFEPDYFSTVLTVQERATYGEQGVCLPPVPHPDSEAATDCIRLVLNSLRLSDARFAELYEERTRALYDLPSPSTVGVLAEYGLMASTDSEELSTDSEESSTDSE